LERSGHRFYTTSDTEAVLHLYEQEGPGCLSQLNGQFAFAIWDCRRRELFLARDRMGIRPLHYAVHEGRLCFASEVKALFALPGMPRGLDEQALDQISTFWTVLPGRTAFQGVHELPPGHYLTTSGSRLRTQRYWDVPMVARPEQVDVPLDAMVERVQDLLLDAVRIRLRADVPVGCYLSGGLDSSGIAALAARQFNAHLSTFGIRFDEEGFDEGAHQQEMVSFLGTAHREVQASAPSIGAAFPRSLWHSEMPVLRTAPVPLFMLSKVVRQSGLKVVLTGEGADEVFGGYNIFKEAKVRRFWARQPESEARAALLGRLYDYVFRDRRARRFLKSFFADDLSGCEDPLFSHRVRWRNTSRMKTFFSDELRAATNAYDTYGEIEGDLPDGFGRLDTVGKAQYLEMKLFLSNYLLSSQGDRMAMANSVEIRLPFLDYRLIEFMATVPSKWKLLGLNEKYILKRALAPVLPHRTCARRKQPYRAPVVSGLLSEGTRDFTNEMLSRRAIASAGLFNADRVERLLKKVQATPRPGEIDSMALAGILSSQIIHHQFVETFSIGSIQPVEPDLVVDKRTGVGRGGREMFRPHRRPNEAQVVPER
jgi:asparagine synthase (glutamine-hydrolysing)